MKRTNVIAHRGASEGAPENTVKAFRQAVKQHVDGIEFDVRTTADGHLVVCHNRTIDATSNGFGAVRNMTFEELRQYDFGDGEKIPDICEALEACKGVKEIIIHVKVKARGDYKDIVKGIIDTSKDVGVANNIVIGCFDPIAIIQAKKYDTSCKTALFSSLWHSPQYVKNIGADAFNPTTKRVNAELVQKFEKYGIKVNVWTVNDERDIENLMRRGVSGIITDIPQKARKMRRMVEKSMPEKRLMPQKAARFFNRSM